ncbi:MAG: hypothetical protein H7X99_07725 [Saprospiraceae bacterium]|nr:hypothetical protein [Saprospiraceae bacterium]
MKQCILVFLSASLYYTTSNSQIPNPDYDKTLAESLGADDNGMKSYIFVILKTGPAIIDDKEIRAEIFSGHMKNIGRLVDEGKLVVAGPFGKNDKSYRGLFILNVKTIEEAKAITDTDPGVKSGIFDVELYPWYGSAALGEYIRFSEKITKFKR